MLFFNIINNYILINQAISESNRTALKSITIDVIVAFYYIFWNTLFQTDSV